MPEIIKNGPPPPPVPPSTYDILGLTEEEMHFLRDLIGKVSRVDNVLHGLYNKLYKSLGSPSAWYTFSAWHTGVTGYDIDRPITTIKAKKKD